jgi:hypothetical protein
MQNVEKLHPKLREVIGRTKTQIYCQGTIYRKCVLAALWTVKLGLTKVGNQAKPLKYSIKKNCIPYQFRADVQMYGHQPQYTADNDAAETDTCTVRMSNLSHTSCRLQLKIGHQVWEYLTITYNDRWIGQGGPIAKPTRSLNLTPIDFLFLWDHIKALIYTLPVDSEEDLIARIVEAAAT